MHFLPHINIFETFTLRVVSSFVLAEFDSITYAYVSVLGTLVLQYGTIIFILSTKNILHSKKN